MRSPWRVLSTQFTEVIVEVLVVAAAISLLVGDLKCALGFTQEQRAERGMTAFKRSALPTVKVRRDGWAGAVGAAQAVAAAT